MTDADPTVHGTWQGHVVVEDDRGVGLIPRHLLTRLLLVAEREAHHRAGAQVLGRSYHHDVLELAHRYVHEEGCGELEACVMCHDAPATVDTLCAACSSGAAGSPLDDREKD